MPSKIAFSYSLDFVLISSKSLAAALASLLSSNPKDLCFSTLATKLFSARSISSSRFLDSIELCALSLL
jgi:hypothetical protein